jgi:adenylyltransferase/sulfurtransferase
VFPISPAKSDFSIIGPVAGTIGTIQATEAIKYIVKRGKLLENKLLVYDGKRLVFDLVDLKRNPKCPDCGEVK